jgi:tetratricopeptide (TPR) repeat protein
MTRLPQDLPGRREFLWIALACFVVFLPPVLSADFLNFDDPRLFGPGSELGAAGWSGIFDPTQTVADAYLPVAHASLSIDRAVFGDRPFGPHLHSLVVHVLVAFSLARLLGRLGLGRAASTAAALVFALHPAVCESVLWVAGRKDLLSALFSILALSRFVRLIRGEVPHGVRGLAGLAGLALLAIYAKGTALVLPLLALPVGGMAVARGVGVAKGAIRLPWLAVAVPVAVGTIHHVSIAAAAGTMAASTSLGERLLQVPGALAHYLTTALVPFGLNILYPEVETLEAFRQALLPSLLILAAAVAVGVVGWRTRSAFVFGIAWFGLALLPFNTALPATSIAAADRYLYLALPGLAMALTSLPRGARIGAVAAVGLALLTWTRAPAFTSSQSVWSASLAADPSNAAARINLALALLEPDPLVPPLTGRKTYEIERLREAEQLLEQALAEARYPVHGVRAAVALVTLARADGRIERAASLARQAAEQAASLPPGETARGYRVQLHLDASRLARMHGDEELARREYEAARVLEPQHPYVLCFEASLLLAEVLTSGLESVADVASDPRAERAALLLDRAEELAPLLYELHWTRGEWARATGRLMAAEKALRTAIDVEPQRPEAWTSRADLWLARADAAETAEKVARDGVRLTGEAGLRFRLALALTAGGKIDEARQHYEAYLAVRPDDPEARAGLATVLAALGYRQLYQSSPEVLDRLADRILELDPENPKALMMKAVAARGRHELLDAVLLLEMVREQMVGDAEVEQLYAESLRDRGWQLRLQEDRPEASLDVFLRFLAVAPPAIPTDAVENLILQDWRRKLQEARDLLVAGDPATAVDKLRRCRQLRPGAEPAVVDYFLGLALFQAAADGAAEPLREALACFESAAAAQTALGGDPGLAVLYRVRTLLRLGEADAARDVADAFLATASADADPDVVDRIRQAIGR